MKLLYTFFFFLLIPYFLSAQETDNITWDTMFVIDGDTSIFTMKGSSSYVEEFRQNLDQKFSYAFVGQPAEDFEAYDIYNQKHSLYNYTGQVVVLYFWAIYDQSSWDEYVSFNRLQEEYFDQGVMVLGLCNDDNEEVINFLSKRKINYPIIPNCKEYGNQYYGGEMGNPRVFVIDKMGMIRHTLLGGNSHNRMQKYSVLKPMVEELLKE